VLKTAAGEAAVGTPSDAPRQRHAHWRLVDAGAPELRDAPLPEGQVVDCRVELVEARPIPAPTEVEIAALGVKAPIVPLGVDKDGLMEAPDGPDVVGWYRTSARAGQPGNSVMSAHIDWRDRLAVFANLGQLAPGDRVVVRGEDGRDYVYAVAWNRAYPKDRAPTRELLATTDDAVLTLISCDGVFDQRTRDYSHRRVVRAELLP
jgi:sortase (surface protein transpeptidase)